jgi:hypothetical protein
MLVIMIVISDNVFEYWDHSKYRIDRLQAYKSNHLLQLVDYHVIIDFVVEYKVSLNAQKKKIKISIDNIITY